MLLLIKLVKQEIHLVFEAACSQYYGFKVPISTMLCFHICKEKDYCMKWEKVFSQPIFVL
uniref:Uncharacterized protein n=1 Tax=Romanomermis culicivorax TaxID=13658 RepID=A0A915KQY4_ROMCU